MRSHLLLGLGTVVLAAGLAVGAWQGQRAADDLGRRQLDLARSLAASFTGSELSAMAGRADEANSPAYRALHERLRSVREASRARFAYWLRFEPSGPHLYFLADSEPTGSPDLSLPGDSYEEGLDLAELVRAVRSGEPTFSRPYSDRWGTWVSAFVPRADVVPGSTDLFGLDLPATEFDAVVWGARARGAAFIWILCGAPVFLIALIGRARRAEQRALASTREAAQLAAVAARIPSGLILTDITGAVRWVNDALPDLLGQPATRMIGRHVATLLQSADTSPEDLGAIYQHLRSLAPLRREMRVASHAEVRWMLIEGQAQRAGGSLPAGFLFVVTDVDARRSAELALSRETGLLGGVLEHAPHGVLVLRPLRDLGEQTADFEVVLANPAAATIAGHALERLRGGRLRHVLPGAVSTGLFDRLVDALADGSRIEMAIAHDTPAGRRWISLLGMRMGEGCLLTLSDVTALKSAEEKFRVVFTRSADAQVLVEEETVVDANEAAARLLAAPHRAGIIGAAVTSLFPAEQADGASSETLWNQILQQAAEGGSARRPWLLRSLAGRLVPTEMLLTRVRVGGRPMLLLIWHDQTERHQVERRIEVSETRLALALESSDQAYWAWGEAEGFQLDPTAPVRLRLPAGQFRIAFDAWRQSAESHHAEAAHETEFSAPGADGRTVWIACRGRRVPPSQPGGAPGMVGTFQLVTARKELETQLRVAKDLAERADRAKSEFLAVMSHEIRTPLNGVIGLANLLAESNPEPVQRECLDAILASADTLLRLLNDVLDLSRIEGGQLSLDDRPYDPGETAARAAGIAAPSALAKGLEVVLEEDADLPALVCGDEDRVQQVLGHLLHNAVKFTERGRITVAARAPESPDPTGHSLVFVVRDTGVGMTPETIQRLFQPFSQADSSSSRRYGGSGLGLALSRRLIERMGGRIELESALGDGTTVTVHLPRRLPTRDAPPPSPVGGLRVGWGVGSGPLRAALRPFLARLGAVLVDAPPAEGEPLLDVVLADASGADDPSARPLLAALRPGGGGVWLQPTLALAGPPPGLAWRPLYLPVRPRDVADALAEQAGRRLPSRLLPVDDSAPPAPAAPAPLATPRPSGPRILVVEDNETNRRVAALTLRRLGLEADFALDGTEALSAVARKPYDCILMDVQLPDQDGFEVTRAIRRLERSGGLPGPSPRIFALTASTADDARERARSCGMDGLMLKPFVTEDLRRILLPESARPAAA